MIATATITDRIVVEVVDAQGIGFAVVDLHGEHYDQWTMYKKLPSVIEVDGRLFGKSCWDSDKCKAYYRTDKSFAKGK